MSSSMVCDVTVKLFRVSEHDGKLAEMHAEMAVEP